MAQLLFANDANTTLAAPLASGALSCSLAAGAGALFPNPGAGQGFMVTFIDAATGFVNEIVLCTARSGDTLTIVRAQEGTSDLNWLAGDLAANLITAGTMEQFPQSFGGAWCGTVGGSANALALTPAIPISAYSSGQIFNFKAAANNTSATTINVSTVGTLALQSQGAALVGGEIITGQWYSALVDASGTTAQLLPWGIKAYTPTWSVVTGSRAFGTPYTNSSAHTMEVLVSMTSGGSQTFALVLGGTTVLTGGFNSGVDKQFSFSVLAGQTYEITVSAGGPTIESWSERS